MKIKPLAVAVGALVPVAAFAATITAPTANKVSPEFLAAQGGVTVGAASVALGVQYGVGDVLTISYSDSAKLNRTSTQTFVFSNTLPISVGGVGGATGTEATHNGVFTKFAESDTSVSYRILANDAPVAIGADNGTVTLDTPVFRSLTDVTVSTSSADGQGRSFDVGAATTLVDVVPSQFDFTFAGLSQTIDVETNRTAFINGSTAAFVTINSDDAFGSPNFAETGTVITATLTGDFSWLDADTSTSATGIQAGNVTGAGVSLSSLSASQIVVTLPATGATIILQNSEGLVIPEQTITASLVQNITSTTNVTVTDSASGSYSLNGSSITVFAVPTSSNVTNFIWLTNSGNSSGEVSVVVNDGGTQTDLGVVGEVGANSEFDLGGTFRNAIESQGLSFNSGRVHLDVITTVPAADVAISAAYNVGGDRVNLITSLETVTSID